MIQGQVDGNNNFMLVLYLRKIPTIWGVPIVKSTQIGTVMSQNSDVIVGKFGGGLYD